MTTTYRDLPELLADELLLARLVGHDQSALKVLVDDHGKSVYAKALQILREPQLAEEVAQDTLSVLWWDPQRLDASKGTVRSFLMGVARHKAIDCLKREEAIRVKQSMLGSAPAAEVIEEDRNVVDSMVMRAAIANLPVTKREVMYLTYYKGLSSREVGRVLHLSEATVRTRIRDSLTKLKTVTSLRNAS